jgi:hypothetical protein
LQGTCLYPSQGRRRTSQQTTWTQQPRCPCTLSAPTGPSILLRKTKRKRENDLYRVGTPRAQTVFESFLEPYGRLSQRWYYEESKDDSSCHYKPSDPSDTRAARRCSSFVVDADWFNEEPITW